MGLLGPQRFGGRDGSGFASKRQAIQSFLFRRQTVAIAAALLFFFVVAPTLFVKVCLHIAPGRTITWLWYTNLYFFSSRMARCI